MPKTENPKPKTQNLSIDVLGIGNAIVDILSYNDESFLVKHSLPKGGMTLIDSSKAAELYKQMGAATECSGGSAANTLAGIASLGGTASFIGKVANDQMGEIFKRDMESIGVKFKSSPLKEKAKTAQCLVFVTEDKETKHVERTMATYLGACKHLSPDDIDDDLIKSAKVTYLEGYLWDEEPAKMAIKKAVEIANKAGKKVAFTCSDAFCVERHRPDFLKLIRENVDILFANEREICVLLEVKNVSEAIQKAASLAEIVAITMSEKGSIILNNGEKYKIEPCEVREVFDVTGAGDLYAAGFLYGYTRGLSLEESGRIGSICAAEIIQYLGARPMRKLSELL